MNIVGIVLASYSIPQILLRIPIGLWTDRLIRRKPMLIAGILFAALGAFGLSMSTEPWLLFLARFIVGVGASMWVVSPIFIAAYYPAEDSGRAIGLVNFVRGGSLILASASGGFIAEAYGFTHVFFIAALIGIIALVALLLAREQPVQPARTLSWKSFSLLATHPLLIIATIIGTLSHFTSFTVLGFVPIYATEIGASSSQLGLIIMTSLIFSTTGALVAVWVWERLGYRSTMILGGLISGVSLLSIPFINEIAVLMAVHIGFGMGNGMLTTTTMALSIRHVQREHQATAMGVFQAVYSLGMLTGPIVSGFLGMGLGLETVFYAAALLSIVGALLPFLPIFSKHLAV